MKKILCILFSFVFVVSIGTTETIPVSAKSSKKINYSAYLKKKLKKNKSVYFNAKASWFTYNDKGDSTYKLYNKKYNYHWQNGLTSRYVTNIDKDKKKEMITVYVGEKVDKKTKKPTTSVKLGIVSYKKKKFKEKKITIEPDLLAENAGIEINIRVQKNRVGMFYSYYSNMGMGSHRFFKVILIKTKKDKPIKYKEYCYSYYGGGYITISELLKKKTYYQGDSNEKKERKAIKKMKKDAKVFPEFFNYVSDGSYMCIGKKSKGTKKLVKIYTDFESYTPGSDIKLVSKDYTGFQKWIKKLGNKWHWFESSC